MILCHLIFFYVLLVASSCSRWTILMKYDYSDYDYIIEPIVVSQKVFSAIIRQQEVEKTIFNQLWQFSVFNKHVSVTKVCGHSCVIRSCWTSNHFSRELIGQEAGSSNPLLSRRSQHDSSLQLLWLCPTNLNQAAWFALLLNFTHLHVDQTGLYVCS